MKFIYDTGEVPKNDKRIEVQYPIDGACANHDRENPDLDDGRYILWSGAR